MKSGNRRLLGGISAAGGALLYGVQPLLIRQITLGGATGLTVVFLRTALAALLSFLLAQISRTSLRLPRKKLKKALLAGVLGYGLTTALLYMSYAYIPTGVATTLHFVYPTVVTAASMVIFREPVKRRTVFALAAGTFGVGCFIGTDARLQSVGVVLALASGVFNAVYILQISKSDFSGRERLAYLLYANAAAAMALGIVGGVSGELRLNITMEAWCWALATAALVGLGANGLFQKGIEQAGPVTAGILSAFEPATSVLCGCLFLRERMTAAKLVGCVLVIASVVLAVPSGKRTVRK